jgi:hypothetical protein
MKSKTAFSNGGSAAARLPSEAGIKPGDAIVVTVLAPGKVIVERAAEVPDYSGAIRRRSRKGGNVTPEMVARLLEQSGL